MDALYRIVDGELAPDELAALTLVLMAGTGSVTGTGAAGTGAARAGAAERHPGYRRQRRTPSRWHRLGPIGAYRSPRSWR